MTTYILPLTATPSFAGNYTAGLDFPFDPSSIVWAPYAPRQLSLSREVDEFRRACARLRVRVPYLLLWRRLRELLRVARGAAIGHPGFEPPAVAIRRRGPRPRDPRHGAYLRNLRWPA